MKIFVFECRTFKIWCNTNFRALISYLVEKIGLKERFLIYGQGGGEIFFEAAKISGPLKISDPLARK